MVRWQLASPPPAQHCRPFSTAPSNAAHISAQHPSLLCRNIFLSFFHAAIMDDLAAQYSFTYEVAKADIDEKAIRHEDAHHLVLRLAHAKAEAIRDQLAAAGAAGEQLDGLLVTCDQVGGWVVFEAVACDAADACYCWELSPSCLSGGGAQCQPPALPYPGVCDLPAA